MSQQQEAFVVMPIQVDGGQPQASTEAQITSAIQSTIRQQETKGPLKHIIAHQDSLYKYISWEDPVRTLGFYLGVMSVLFGAHYIPLTRYVLKIGAVGFGAVSLVEYSGRMFNPNTFLARLRPKEYRQVPESTLNATLKDVHDLVQYLVVKVQRIIWGQDLGNTFATFLAFTGLYWLAQILSPFWLAVLGVHSLFVAPLVSSPRGRQVTQDAMAGAGNLVNAAAEKGTTLAQGGQAKAQQLSTQASDVARHIGQRSQDLAESGRQAAVNATQQVQITSANVARRGGDLAQNGQETASDLSNQAKQTASNAADSVTDNVARPLGRDPFHTDSGVTDTSSSRADLYSNDLNTNEENYTHGGGNKHYQSVSKVDSGIMNRGPPLSHQNLETPRKIAPPPPARKPGFSSDPILHYDGSFAATYK